MSKVGRPARTDEPVKLAAVKFSTSERQAIEQTLGDGESLSEFLRTAAAREVKRRLRKSG